MTNDEQRKTKSPKNRAGALENQTSCIGGGDLCNNLRIMLVFSLLVFLCLGKPSFQGWRFQQDKIHSHIEELR
jgi:hypothetical protein